MEVLRLVAIHASLRTLEVAAGLWPNAASQSSAYEMARRTLSRLVAQRLLVERLNPVGGKSVVLTPHGAHVVESYFGRGLDLWSDAPQGASVGDGYDVVVNGACFRHKTITAAYLMTRFAMGQTVWPEHAIERGWAPADRAALKRQWAKIPDGLIYVGGPHRKGTTRLVDWVEVESSLKPNWELKRVLELAWRLNRPLADRAYLRVGRLVIVYDEADRHERRILRAALEVARDHATEEARSDPKKRLPDDAPFHFLIDRYERQLAEVDLVRATIHAPLTVESFETITLLDALRRAYQRVPR
jgi:hypothetical protein